MEALLSPTGLAQEIEALAAGHYLADPIKVIAQAASLFRLPEQISTVECAEKHRKLRTAQGDGAVFWSRALTPYNVGPMDALDDPDVQEVIVAKPGRSGGTVAFENYLFKLMRYGPMGDVGWYLKSESEVEAYTSKGFKDLFDGELHPEIRMKIGPGRGDDKLAHKKVDGRTIDVMPANPTTFTNRQFYFMFGDEIDTYQPRICASFLDQARVRGRALGTNRKVGMASHADRGWTTGIAAAWMETSRGIWVWPCADCGMWSSPYPTKFWPDVPRTTLWYEKAQQGADRDARVKMAEQTAALLCPHCGSSLNDGQRHAMVDAGRWMHRGQMLDAGIGICGDREPTGSMGFWVHGTMSKMITNAELARDMESALERFEATRKVDKLREVTAKVFGEVFEGTGPAGALDSGVLYKRSKAANDRGDGFAQGAVPDGVLFVTQSIDVGHGKFDVGTWGWDLEGRSWLIDRVTIRQRVWNDGLAHELRPAERIEDWHVLDAHIDRKLPLAGDPDRALPIAVTLIDTGDGNVTWKAYEYCRRMSSRRWGDFAAVRPIKGAKSPAAPELPVAPTPISKDQNGREVAPVIRLYMLGVSKLKEQAVERLAVDDEGPGYCRFAYGVSRRHLDEFFGERLIDGKWERHGDNESLDLFGYAEAGRLMLKPDRKGIAWSDPDRRPPWARPIALYSKGGDLAAEAEADGKPEDKALTRFERYRELRSVRNSDG